MDMKPRSVRRFLTTCLVGWLVVCGTVAQGQEGLQQRYHANGRLAYTRYELNGRVHFISYHENGRVHEMGAYRHGAPDGCWKQFSDQGVQLAHALFSEGKRQGEWEVRTPNDQLHGRISYVDGRLKEGTLYGADGMVIARRDY